jgi:hypothetical protein
MNKFWLVVLLFAGTLAGCGDNNPPGPPAGIEDPKFFCHNPHPNADLVEATGPNGTKVLMYGTKCQYQLRNVEGHPVRRAGIPVLVQAAYPDEAGNLWAKYGFLNDLNVNCPGPAIVTVLTNADGIIEFTASLRTSEGFLPDGAPVSCSSGAPSDMGVSVLAGPHPVTAPPHLDVTFCLKWPDNKYARVVNGTMRWSATFVGASYYGWQGLQGLTCDAQSCAAMGIEPSSHAAQLALTQPICDCGPLGMDIDEDGDVDQEDFGIFQVCYDPLALELPAHSPCQCFDLDYSGAVDLNDFGLLQRCLSGPGIPADPTCLQ